MRTSFAAAITAAALALAGPASAVEVILDFGGSACPGGSCSNTEAILAGYGDTTGLDVSYRSLNHPAGTVYQPYLKYWLTFGDLSGVVWGGANDDDYRSENIFDALDGFEISLRSFDVATFARSTPSSPFAISSLGGVSIFAGDIATNPGAHNHFVLNGAYFSDGIRLGWGPDGYNVGVDNLVLDIRAVTAAPAPLPIPEPALWAMMIAGFGTVGGLIRHVRRRGGALRVGN